MGLRASRRRDWGRLWARLLCSLFAVVGAVPLALTLLVRTPAVQAWGARQVSALLQAELGLSARFRVRVEAWPPAVTVEDLVVDATDGEGPALTVARASARPRPFALLGGRIDVGEVEIERPHVRLVVRDGALANLKLELPKASGGARPTRLPFAAIAVTDATLDVDVDGVRVKGQSIDADATAEPGAALELAVRAEPQVVTRVRDGATDEDALCQLEARVRVDADGVLVRRLVASGVADADDAPGTLPSCAALPDDPRRVEIALTRAHVRFGADDPVPEITGGVRVRAPLPIVNRFVPAPRLRGWVRLDVEGERRAGSTLPEVAGRVEAHGFELSPDALGTFWYRLAPELAADLAIDGDAIRVPQLSMRFADGDVLATGVVARPLAPHAPLEVASLDVSGARFPGLMRDLAVTDHTHVGWRLDHVRAVAATGTLAPLHLDAEFTAKTSDFEVWDAAWDDARRRRMIGVREAKLAGKVQVRPDALTFAGARVDFGDSHLETTVSIGFHNQLDLSVARGSTIRLGDVSPIASLALAGKATVAAEMHGLMDDPTLVGDLAISALSLADLPVGDVTAGRVAFHPLKVDFEDVRVRSGESTYAAPSLRLDFDGPSNLTVTAAFQAEKLTLADFFRTFRFDDDPRFEGLAGKGSARASVRWDLGGPNDPCGAGRLAVRGAVKLTEATLFDERYDGGDAELSYTWVDRAADDFGLEVDVPSFSLRKGRGTIFGSASIRPGGAVRASVAASDVPLAAVQGLGVAGAALDGTASAVATVGGTIDALEADVDVHVTPVSLGRGVLPASSLRVALRPPPTWKRKVLRQTRCGNDVGPPFDRDAFAADPLQGTFEVNGHLFGGAIDLDHLFVTRQRHKVASGRIALDRLDLGEIAALSPTMASRAERPRGSLSAVLAIDEAPLDEPARARGTLTLRELDFGTSAGRVALHGGPYAISLADDRLDVPELTLDVGTPSGMRGAVALGGRVAHVSTAPEVDLALRVPPTDLGPLAGILPGVERAGGTLEGRLAVRGPLGTARYDGSIRIAKGELALRGTPAGLTDLELDVAIGEGEVRIAQGRAHYGGGQLTLEGRAPLQGTTLGDLEAVLRARGVQLPMNDGIQAVADADLKVRVPAAHEADDERPLPTVVGDVTLTSFAYTRPISVAADIGSLAQRGKRRDFRNYDPADDLVTFDVRIRSKQPLRLRNNLVDAQLALDSEALSLTGTNQRFGLRGQLRVMPAGRLRLRTNEFEVRQGFVRFEDPTRIAPRVDVTAVTEYRRYSEAQPGAGAGASSGGSSGSAGAGGVGRAGGTWRIGMHAYGDAEDLKLELTSEPTLSQEDIVLLLTIGMTRAEIDQLQASSLGEAAALEALSALTGADTAVKQAVPVIDDFRFGSAYSSRTGRTEPTVTIGKRATEQVRASVTSGLSDNREVRTNLEWKLGPRVSVQGSYDNVNDVSSSSLGNLGANVRYRLEFE